MLNINPMDELEKGAEATEEAVEAPAEESDEVETAEEVDVD